MHPLHHLLHLGSGPTRLKAASLLPRGRAWTLTSGAGDEYITPAVYTDRETYTKNSNDERQQRWFQCFRELLAEDPSWNDGEVIEGVNLGRA